MADRGGGALDEGAVVAGEPGRARFLVDASCLVRRVEVAPDEPLYMMPEEILGQPAGLRCPGHVTEAVLEGIWRTRRDGCPFVFSLWEQFEPMDRYYLFRRVMEPAAGGSVRIERRLLSIAREGEPGVPEMCRHLNGKPLGDEMLGEILHAIACGRLATR